MLNVKPVTIPMEANSALTLHSGNSLQNPIEYCTFVGNLQYLYLI